MPQPAGSRSPAQVNLSPATLTDSPFGTAGGRWASRSPGQVLARENDPAWTRPALFGLLLVTTLLYLWNLSASGWANAFYSAAVEAGTRNWKAFFFGSFDASNFITVDKSPAALWVMEVSARIFGVNSWSILAPQALEGVATVAVLYLAVRRWFGPAAGLVAGAVLALTPVAALMFRFNNPDALLVLLLTAATYAVLRALESGRTGWLVLGGALIGTAFLAKMLQAYVVVPVLFGVYLLAGRPRPARRLWQLLLGTLALLVSSAWWVAVVELTPASARPYIGGSQTNSVLELMLGYNGFGRLTGQEAGSVGGFGPIGSRWGVTGWDRLFNPEFGGQISWLIPAAIILLGAGLWVTRGRPRTDIQRVALLVWGGTLLLTGAVFSFAQGIIHPYYTVALGPAIGAVVGMSAVLLWKRRGELWVSLTLAVALAVTALWSFYLLDLSPQWYPALRWAVLVAGLAAAFLVVVVPTTWTKAAMAGALLGLVASLAGPAAFTVETVRTPHTGAIPSAGPAVTAFAAGRGGPGGGGPGGGGGAGGPGGGFGARPGAGFAGPASGFGGRIGAGAAGRFPGGGGGFRGGGPGGLLDSSQPGSDLVAMLQAQASQYRWVAATVDANNAAGYQLATADPVMAIGGFNGTDPAPTLDQFRSYVEQGKVHYFLATGGRGPAAGGSATEITSWVQAHFSSQTVDGVTVYDLSRPTS